MFQPTTRMYILRPVENWGPWARIWITDDGCFTTISDHGNYGYWWPQPGCEFRKFLCEIDDSYIIGKLSGGRNEYDGEATRKLIQERLKRLHGEGEDTREELDLLADAELDNIVGFTRWVDAPGENGERLLDYYNRSCECAVYRHSMQVQMFVKHLWPRFVEMLRAELAAETANTSAGCLDPESSLGLFSGR